MKLVLFRTDASHLIGNGHVMRCLTLATALSERGYVCKFICRNLPGSLHDMIWRNGFDVYSLSSEYNYKQKNPYNERNIEYEFDNINIECIPLFERLRPEWVVVDHYAIDCVWEIKIKDYVSNVLVIDDLANRPHSCDVLLDQNYGRTEEHYIKLVPKKCEILCGTKYTLLRDEFLAWREISLNRRSNSKIENILISMGGTDGINMTCKIIDILKLVNFPSECRITIVLGSNSPWIKEVRESINSLNVRTNILIGVKNMAELLTNADLAIGAAGSTSWERCVLGVPTIMFSVAENQGLISEKLIQEGAAIHADLNSFIVVFKNLFNSVNQNEILSSLSLAAKDMVDGQGTKRVVDKMTGGVPCK